MKKLVLVLIALAFPPLLKAQHWVQLTTPPLTRLNPNYGRPAPYFLNLDTGFAYSAGLSYWGSASYGTGYDYDPRPATDIVLARTSDGGKSWNAITTLNGAAITQVYFIDAQNGFLSVAGSKGGIYETQDAGITWKKITTSAANFTGVYVAGGTIFASTLTGPIEGPLYISSNDGKTWAMHNGSFSFVFGNKDSLVLSISHPANGNPVLHYSTNLGRTWTSSQPLLWKDAGVLYVIPHSCRVIQEYLDSLDDEGDTYSFSVSDFTEQYNTWHSSLLHVESGAYIAGDGCNMYLCNAHGDDSNPTGYPKFNLYRSTDLGVSWQRDSATSPHFVEIDDDDFHNLSVIGSGSVIFAADYWQGNLWSTTDGGDGTVSVTKADLTFDRKPFVGSNDTLFVKACGIDSLITFFETSLCHHATLDSLSLRGLDPSEYFRYNRHNYSQCDNEADTTVFLIKPQKRGPRHLSINARITDDNFNTYLRTLNFIVVTPPRLAPKFSQQQIDIGTISTCDAHDTLITIYNHNCDSLVLTDAHLAISGPFRIDSIPIPSVILGQHWLYINVHFHASAIGTYNDKLITILKSADSSYYDTIELTGRTTSLTSIVLPQSPLSMGAFSFCDGDSTMSVLISSKGCDTLVLSNLFLEQKVGFSIIDSIGDSLLLPGKSKTIRVHFAPRQKGEQYDTLRLAWHLLNDRSVLDTSIDLAGIGLPGTRLISATPPAIDLGSIYSCEFRDTTIIITNPGCDTLHVTGGSFSDPSITSSTIYPDTVPPGGSLTVTVHVDTSRSNGAAAISGSYVTQSDAQNSIQNIPINLQIIPPVHLVLQIEPPQSGGNRQKVTYLILVVGPHPAKLFSSFYFDLMHNDDLLSFDTAIGDGLSVVNDPQVSGVMTQHCILAPVPLTDTIGKLIFTAYLSPVDTTSLEPMKFSFKNALSLSPDCIATLDDSGSTFTYIPSCGDGLLQAVLRSERIKIDRIVPNPARDEVRIKGRGLDGLEVYDVMGRRLDVPKQNMVDGVTLDVRGLAEGMYYLQIGNAASQFVIER